MDYLQNSNLGEGTNTGWKCPESEFISEERNQEKWTWVHIGTDQIIRFMYNILWRRGQSAQSTQGHVSDKDRFQLADWNAFENLEEITLDK